MSVLCSVPLCRESKAMEGEAILTIYALGGFITAAMAHGEFCPDDDVHPVRVFAVAAAWPVVALWKAVTWVGSR